MREATLKTNISVQESDDGPDNYFLRSL
jgi:putative heme degradation protein